MYWSSYLKRKHYDILLYRSICPTPSSNGKNSDDRTRVWLGLWDWSKANFRCKCKTTCEDVTVPWITVEPCHLLLCCHRYRNEEDFGEQRFSVDAPRDGFGGDSPRGDVGHSGPLVIEHDHGIAYSRSPSRWEQFDGRRDVDPDFERQRSPRPVSSSQERFRTPDRRSDDREGARGHHFQDKWRDFNYETRRSPTTQDRPNTMRYGNRDGPVNLRGRGGFRPMRGRSIRGQGGKTGPQRNQQHFQQSSQGYQDPPREEQRPGYRPVREDSYEDPAEQEDDWAEETRLQEWKHDRPGSLDRHLPKIDLDPKMPRQRLHQWNDQKTNNVTVVTEETLTIKVDMSRPVNQNR